MTTPRFRRCLDWVLAWEGGFNDIAADRGGATNHGISLRFAQSLGRMLDVDLDGHVTVNDIRILTRDQAAAVYWQHFWQAARCDDLPKPMDLVVFCSVVNCGAGAATRWMQGAVGVRADGIIGPLTMAAIRRVAADARLSAAAAHEVLAQRIRHHVSLGASQQQAFGLGWSRRLASLGIEVGQQLSEGTNT